MSEQLYICPQANKCSIEECEHKHPHAHEYVCGWENCDDAPDKGQSTVCVLFRATSHIAQVRVDFGLYWTAPANVTFRTQFDIDNSLGGKTFRAPYPESLGRLSRLLYERGIPCYVDHLAGEIIFGDQTPKPDLFSWTAKKDRQEQNGN